MTNQIDNGDYIFNYRQYKSNINNRNNLSIIWLFLFVVLLSAACLYFKPTNNNILDFHFLEIDCFPTYQQALNLSKKINAQNGAGYIYFDGEYHVFASFYSSKKQAESVLKNLSSSFTNPSIFTITTNKFTTTKKLSIKQNDIISQLVDESEKTFLMIEDISNKFDSGKISFNESDILLTNLFDDYNSTHSNFIKEFSNNSKYNVIKNYENNMFNSISNIEKSDEQNLSSCLRYELINFVINRYYLLSCF